MEINHAVEAIEKFLLEYRENNDDWSPSEIRVLPSGDENNHIKLWFNFGPGTAEAELAGLTSQAVDALSQAHPQIADDYDFEARAVAD